MISFSPSEQERISFCREGLWVTSSNNVVSVKDMSDYHIDSCLKMLEYKDDYLSELQRDMFRDEQLRRFNRYHDGIFGGSDE